MLILLKYSSILGVHVNIHFHKLMFLLLRFVLLCFFAVKCVSLYAAEKDNIIEQQSENIIISIQDDIPFHVHPDGKSFRIRVKIDTPLSADIYYQWFDYQGNALSEPVWVKSKRLFEVQSPDSKVGYYGLVFKTNDRRFKFSNRQWGEKREFGFAIIKPRIEAERLIDPDSPFGIVHAQLKDPALPAWIKTLTWKTYSARYWKVQIAKREQSGLMELPLIVGYEWKTDDSKVVTTVQLTALGNRIKRYFKAQPNVLYWELGLEENLQKRFGAKYYWNNLTKKIKKIREIANEVNPQIKFIYQIAGLNIQSTTRFAQNAAANHFDVLSLHPYAWPDFIAPEKWLVDYLDDVRRVMKEYGHGKPIWFTEVGVPHQGNYKGGFFGYPKLGREVKGHTAMDVANYMIKLHVMALSKDVKKLFWYNYQDRKQEREEVENHFGLIDYWGYPKPVYAAYVNLIDRVNGKQFVQTRQLSSGLWVFEFKGNHEIVWVTWCYPACKKNLSWSDILKEIKVGKLTKIVNSVGTPLVIDKDMIHFTGEPVFITTRKSRVIADNSAGGK